MKPKKLIYGLAVISLKGRIGDRNHELSSELDLNKYRAVTIWCKRFGVNFATEPLTAADIAMNR